MNYYINKTIRVDFDEAVELVTEASMLSISNPGLNSITEEVRAIFEDLIEEL